jgi:hypothetical protein
VGRARVAMDDNGGRDVLHAIISRAGVVLEDESVVVEVEDEYSVPRKLP